MKPRCKIDSYPMAGSKISIFPSNRVFPRRLTNGEIFNNRLLFENNRLFFFQLFSGPFCGGQGLDGGDKVVMGGSPSALH